MKTSLSLLLGRLALTLLSVVLAVLPDSSWSQTSNRDGTVSCEGNLKTLVLYQRNYPDNLRPPCLVNLYCGKNASSRRLLAKNLTLCSSNFNGSEQKAIEIVLAPADRLEKLESASVCRYPEELQLYQAEH